MKVENIGASLGTGISVVIATLFALYGNPIISSLFTFLVGAFVTFMVQSELQDRSEKRKIRVDAINSLHIPLYFQIQHIKNSLLLELEDLKSPTGNSLHELTLKPQMFTIPDLSKKIEQFEKGVQNFQQQINGIKGIARKIINEKTQDTLLPTLRKNNMVPIPDDAGGVFCQKRYDDLSFLIELRRPDWEMYVPITNIAILKQNPLKFLEKYQRFDADQILLQLYVSYIPNSIPGAFNPYPVQVELKRHGELFNNFWVKTVNEISVNADIQKFNNVRQELIKNADAISSRLKKFIENYVEVEEI